MKSHYYFFLLLIPILGLFVGTGMYLNSYQESWMEDRMLDQLHKNAKSIEAIFNTIDLSADSNSISAFINTINNNNDIRVSLINEQGSLFEDSSLTLEQMSAQGNYNAQPEIISASQNSPGFSIRYSDALNTDTIYLAIPYMGETWTGFIRASISSAKAQEKVFELSQVQNGVGIVVSISLIFIILISYFLLNKNNNANRKELHKKVMDRTNDLMRVQQFGQMLSSCLNRDELTEIVSSTASSLFPNSSGALSILHPSMDTNEVIASWGESWSGQKEYSPSECWAFRQGSIYISSIKGFEIQCKHIQTNDLTVCVPLSAQGTAIGALHLILHEGKFDDIKDMFMSMSDNVSLSLANINLRESLKRQATRDPLTNLYNRRYLDEAFDKELSRASRQSYGVGVMMIDVDHFKIFNDSFGHDAGDQVLQVLGGLLLNITRDDDIACRFGGEEFVMILPNTTMETLKIKANKLLEEARCLELSYKNKSLGNITLSIGLSIYPECGETPETLIAMADKGLYLSKSQGRNQVQIASEERAPAT